MVQNHFNTSNVKVQRDGHQGPRELRVNFNTSNVKVQHERRSHGKERCLISIHLMLRFNRFQSRLAEW